jgi:type II secretory pathway predicted ATPase ExeA
MLSEFLTALKQFEDLGTHEEHRLAVHALGRLHKRLSIRAMSEAEQRIALILAETNQNRDELRNLLEHSQFPDIVSWAKETLAPRSGIGPRLSL